MVLASFEVKLTTSWSLEAMDSGIQVQCTMRRMRMTVEVTLRTRGRCLVDLNDGLYSSEANRGLDEGLLTP